ncbi:peroxisomal membrane protein pex14 [Entomortierella chlamydospora]|uniref:Peroxisomal membrane protein PEX14 n=1 Tax=Entomortierella chlamydospora TaxID=101097 RepID=A0A9P6MMQ8_9FUNG|nr:peroxisomal membrane protein pex14 [Entomortierella chlamydospora]KAG0007424.1 peroxisomal membrane protein pex14 [Entomortierella chlamydospora]
MSGNREDILASAVKFLQDPKVQSSALGKKVSFLESKGLTSQEIEEAMRRANGTGTAVPVAPVSTALVPAGALPPGAVQYAQVPPPPLPAKYDWKDMFIAAVVAGGFSYTLWQIAKSVVGPKLQWPSQEELEMDKKKLDEQFEEIEKSLAEVKDSTTVVAKNVEDQTAHVKESLEGMSGVLDTMKTNDQKREQELTGLKTDIENIKDMIPKLMEKSKESQANVLNELQTEIKSLKSLLLNRRGPGAGPATPGSATGSVAAPWNAAYSSTSSLSQPTTPSVAAAASAPKAAEEGGPLNFSSGKAAIPAWQLAAQKPAPAASSTATPESSNAEISEATTSA